MQNILDLAAFKERKRLQLHRLITMRHGKSREHGNMFRFARLYTAV